MRWQPPGTRSGAPRWLGILLIVLSACRSDPAKKSGDDCCHLTVAWRSVDGSPLRISGSPARQRLEGRLHWVGQRYAEHGICVDWRQDPHPAPATLVAGEEESPVHSFATLSQLAAENGDGPVTMLLVPQLVSWSTQRQQHVRRKGATPGAGARIAAVRYDDGRGDAVAVFNELLHVLGLTDHELGVGPGHPQHEPDPAMWTFMREVCRTAADPVAKRRLIVEKERCLAENPRSSRCYGS